MFFKDFFSSETMSSELLASIAATRKSVIKNSKIKDNFIIKIPDAFVLLGAILDFVCVLIMVCFTLFSDEKPHYIFYVIFGFFTFVGLYLIVRTITFKVVVKGKTITVFSAMRRPYTFTFDDVISVVRQVKQNKVNSERMIIRTKSKRKLILENAEISYANMLVRIKSEVPAEFLKGF